MSNYWDKRSVQRMFESMELAESAANELSKIYLKSSRYLSLEADEIFEKFQRKHHLSEEQARKLIAELHDSSSIDELLRLLKSDPKNKELAAELESVAYQARLERLRQLQNEINLVMVEVYQQEKNFTTPFYADLANETYYKTMFDIQQRIDIGFSFNHISEKQINKVLSMDWSGENYSKRIWKNTQNLAKDLREELLVNLLTGRTNREAAEIISNKFASGASKARRLVRTESNFISSELNFEAYKEAGIEEYQFLATLDLKTSKICRELDGKKFKVSERKVGVNCNPMHPWCRSTTVAVVDEKYAAQKMRSARAPETGEVIKVPQSMDYKEWYDKYVKGNPEEELASNHNMSKFTNMLHDYNNGQKDIISHRSIQKNLNQTNIGKETIEYIINHPELNIYLCYKIDAPENMLGMQEGNDIYIYASKTETVQKTSETLIHEIAHHRYDIGGDQWSECVCRAQELKHRKKTDKLTGQELRDIIKSVKIDYSELKWRR